MTKLIVVTRDGIEHQIEAGEGISVMEAVRDAGFDEMMALCGGCCSCATCHVHIDPEFAARIPSISPDEDDLLDSSDHRDACSRLGCQVRLTAALDGLRVTIAQQD